MHRLLVSVLAALDALVTGAIGVAVVLVPVTALWVFGGPTDWSSLWPTTAAVWRLGHLVPLAVHLPVQYLTDAGIAGQAASFTVSLAPLALTGLTVVLAARSGLRAGRSGAWLSGVVGGTVVYAALAAAMWSTGRSAVVASLPWQALVLPIVVFAVPVLVGAVVAAWADDDGMLGRLRDAVDDVAVSWRGVPALAVRGAVGVLVSLCGLGAAAVFVALVARSGQIVALYQTANLDGVGGAVVSTAQLAYLPTLVMWGIAFLAGPGFAIGAGTAVSPAGTDLGVLPGIPVLGALPSATTPWLLLVVVLPVGAGALAGRMLRLRMPSVSATDPLVRGVLAAAVAVLSGAGAAGLAALAAGAFGPGRFAQLGPHPGPVAAAVAAEVFVGAAAFLVAPERAGDRLPPPSASSPRRPARVGRPPSAARHAPAGDVPTESADAGRLGGRPDPIWPHDGPG